VKFIERSPRRRRNHFLESRRLVDSPKLARSRPRGHNKISNKSTECSLSRASLRQALSSLVDKSLSRHKRIFNIIPWGKSRGAKSTKFGYGNRCPLEYALRSKRQRTRRCQKSGVAIIRRMIRENYSANAQTT